MNTIIIVIVVVIVFSNSSRSNNNNNDIRVLLCARQKDHIVSEEARWGAVYKSQ